VNLIAAGNVKLPSIEKAPPHSISIVSGVVMRVLTWTRFRSVIAGARVADSPGLRPNSAAKASGDAAANRARIAVRRERFKNSLYQPQMDAARISRVHPPRILTAPA